MDQTTRETILGDCRRAQRNVERILDDPASNRFIANPDYLSPTVLNESCVRLDAPEGELMYYRRIRDGLEAALVTGTIPHELRPPRAPAYIEKLYR